MTLYPLFQNALILRRPGVVIFADIIKIITMFLKQLRKTQEKFKKIESMYQDPIYMWIS